MNRRNWWLDAACRGQGINVWFPRNGQITRGHKAMCGACPVKLDCLTDAVDNDACGIWAATTEAQRAAMKRSREVTDAA